MIKNKKVLVTGGAGTVGCNVVKKLVEREADVTVIDNLGAYPFDYLHDYGIGDMQNVEFINGDITDRDLITNNIKNQDIVIHAAALADDPSIPDKIAKGQFTALLDWMRSHIHVHGSKLLPADLMTQATGKEPSSDAFVDYLQSKFTKIYGL